MAPLAAFVAVDLWAKYSGRSKTTSRILRENRIAAGCLFVWGVYHIFFEEATYES